MSEEIVSFLKMLKVPLLNADEVAALRQLEEEWRHWEQRSRAIMARGIETEQKEAYAAFLDDPSSENEHRLAVLADPVLTEKRYALLRQAFEDLRGRVGTQAGKILRPALSRIREALSVEHERRREKVKKFMDSQDRDPHVREIKLALDFVECISRGVQRTNSESPLTMASVLAKG